MIYKKIIRNRIYYYILVNKQIYAFDKFAKKFIFLNNKINLKNSVPLKDNYETKKLAGFINKKISELENEEKEILDNLDINSDENYYDEIHGIKNMLLLSLKSIENIFV